MAGEESTPPEEQTELIKTTVLARLKRIEGQVRGIQRMVEAGKECDDILVQVRAVRSALQAAKSLILKRFLLQCYVKAIEENEDPDIAFEQAVKTLTTFSDE